MSKEVYGILIAAKNHYWSISIIQSSKIELIFNIFHPLSIIL